MEPSKTRAGEAKLHIGNISGRSTVIGAEARNPFRLLTPRARGESVWVYTGTFGGGMVAGDCTRLEVAVDAGGRCFLGTQSSTKIYRNPTQLPCSHETVARIGDDALLILAPDPVQCFAESCYTQRQHFSLAESASLLLVDWLSAGRTARGERWSFRHYISHNEIVRVNQRVLVDALRLSSDDGALDAKYRGSHFNCFATVVLLGPKLAEHASALLEWCNAQAIQAGTDLIFAASPLREGAILRLAGASVEAVGHAIHEQLRFISELLEDNPWSRKW